MLFICFHSYGQTAHVEGLIAHGLARRRPHDEAVDACRADRDGTVSMPMSGHRSSLAFKLPPDSPSALDTPVVIVVVVDIMVVGIMVFATGVFTAEVLHV